MGLEVFDNYECDGQRNINEYIEGERELTHLSLFAGFGGLDLAAEMAGIKTVGQCEFADYPTKVMEKHWPDVPRWRDIRTLTGEVFYARTGRRTVDVISGGFPCQPFSNAGKRRGKEDDRYLWPEMVRVIKELRPTWVVGENVAGIVNMELDTVLFDLEAEGYQTRTFLIPAHAVGAPHRRYRVAIVAHTDSSRQLYRKFEVNPAETREPAQSKLNGCRKTMADSESHIEGRLSSGEKKEESRLSGSGKDGNVCNTAGERFPIRTGEKVGGQETQEQESKRPDSNVSDTDNGCQHVWRDPCQGGAGEARTGWKDILRRETEHGIRKWWDVEPGVGRVVNGIPNRVERLRGLGNAAVRQQFYPVYKAIADIELMN